MNDPKPTRRIVNRDCQPLDGTPIETRRCPLCGGSMFSCSRAHVVAKSQGGDDLSENMAWICGDGTRGCHGVLTHRGRGDHGLDYRTVAKAFVFYCRRTVPQLGAYADREKWPFWLEDQYLGWLNGRPLDASEEAA